MAYNVFGSIPVPKKGRTNFDLSHSLAGTFSMSDLQPVLFLDCLPGTSYRIKVWNLTKLETLIAPAMQQVNASLLTFKVPKRLCFKFFKEWYSGGPEGTSEVQKPHWNLFSLLSTILTISSSWSIAAKDEWIMSLFGPGTLWNYLGLPCPVEYNSVTGVWQVIPASSLAIERGSVDSSGNYKDSGYIDAMPFIAYWLLHDEYFMDQTLGKRMFVTEGDLKMNDQFHYTFTYGGSTLWDTTTDEVVGEGGELSVDSFLVLNQMFKRAWRKEYFTSALPTPQRGPEVKLDMFAGSVPVQQDDEVQLTATNSLGAADTVVAGSDTGDRLGVGTDPLNIEIHSSSTPAVTGLSVDLSGLSPITIAAFRNLFKLQAFLEKNNVAGGRFIETILAHWGERVPDFTVQRPVHVRSTSIPVQISEITAMANSSGVNSQLGDQAGRAKGMGNIGSFRIYTQEPSFVFSLYCVTVPPAYASQGIPRIFQHVTRFDEPWTDFQHIGEQAIKNRELFLDWKGVEDNYNQEDFGYQQRFSEYKYLPDRIVGDFQTSLAYWTMARMFNQLPYLNEDFVTHQPDPRIFAVQMSRPITASFYFDIKAKQKLSKFSTPKLT